MTNKDLLETLEALVDKHGLDDVLATIGEVCSEKAEHVRSNWQDRNLAKWWDKAAKACMVAAGYTLTANKG